MHIRCKGQCQLCGCGGAPLDFDLWRQMTVEHLIGRSQGGYMKQIIELVEKYFSLYSSKERELLSKEIDSINTVTACQFCNSTTSRDVSDISMSDLFIVANGSRESLIKEVSSACGAILNKKRKSVAWKLESIREAFEGQVNSKIERK